MDHSCSQDYGVIGVVCPRRRDLSTLSACAALALLMPLMGAGSAAAAEAPAELYEGHLAEHTQPGRGEPLARGWEFSDPYTTSQTLRFTVVEDEAAAARTSKRRLAQDGFRAAQETKVVEDDARGLDSEEAHKAEPN